MHTLLTELGMQDTWNTNALTRKEAKKWRDTIREKIRAREETQWLARMQNKPKLRTYRQLKTKLHFEHSYLTTRDREAREVMMRLRGGTNELRIETGRYAITNRDRRLDVSERRCLICLSGEIEDETHFLLDCDGYEDLRKKMFVVFQRTLAQQHYSLEIEKARKEVEGRKRLMAALVGDLFAGIESAELKRPVLEFCKRAMKRRYRLVRTVLDQKT